MKWFLLGVAVGYVAKDEIRSALKGSVKTGVRLKNEILTTYASLKEDFEDAVTEATRAAQEEAARMEQKLEQQAASSAPPGSAPTA